MDKTPMAAYYCRLAKSKSLGIAAVKVLDFTETKFEEGTAYCKELGKSFCN
jgi:hypothetical protein